MTQTLRADIARCVPAQPCPQHGTCARAQAPIESPRMMVSAIDGSVTRPQRSKACWLYLDVRGMELIAREWRA